MPQPTGPQDIDITDPNELLETRVARAAEARNEQDPAEKSHDEDARNEDTKQTKDLRVPVTRSKAPFDRETHGKDDVIDVHFDGVSWCIEDSSLAKDLQFSHLADAEARASELSKSTGRSVCVHGQDGELIDSFKSKD